MRYLNKRLDILFTSFSSWPRTSREDRTVSEYAWNSDIKSQTEIRARGKNIVYQLVVRDKSSGGSMMYI